MGAIGGAAGGALKNPRNKDSGNSSTPYSNDYQLKPEPPEKKILGMKAKTFYIVGGVVVFVIVVALVLFLKPKSNPSLA
jgi:hypothetical protein